MKSPDSVSPTARVFIEDDLATVGECRLLTDFFPKGILRYGAPQRDDAWTSRVISAHRILDSDDLPIKRLLDQIASRIVGRIGSFFGPLPLTLLVSQLVVWPDGSDQDPHLDEYFAEPSIAAIVYLNDGFDGGETVLLDSELTVTPKPGRIVAFEGSRRLHRVSRVSNGVRYTNAVWFRTSG